MKLKTKQYYWHIDKKLSRAKRYVYYDYYIESVAEFVRYENTCRMANEMYYTDEKIKSHQINECKKVVGVKR